MGKVNLRTEKIQWDCWGNESQIEKLGIPKGSLTWVCLSTQVLGTWVWGREQEDEVTPRVPATVQLAWMLPWPGAETPEANALCPVPSPELAHCFSMYSLFFNCGKMHATLNLPFGPFQVYNSVASLTCTMLCTITTVWCPQLFYHPKQKLYTIKQNFPISPCSQLLETTILPSVAMNWTILGTSCQWNHAIFVLVCPSQVF